MATGAIYFIASPVSLTDVFVLLAASANTSATCPASDASNPNPRKVAAAISELVAKSSPDAAAKSKSPGIASIISVVVNPAAAKFSIPCAASVAEKAVSAPNCIAKSFNFLNSSFVAPEIAFTLDICASNSEPTLTDAVSPVVIAATAPVIATDLKLEKALDSLPLLFSASCVILLNSVSAVTPAFLKAFLYAVSIESPCFM